MPHTVDSQKMVHAASMTFKSHASAVYKNSTAWPRIEIHVIWLNFVGLFATFRQNVGLFCKKYSVAKGKNPRYV